MRLRAGAVCTASRIESSESGWRLLECRVDPHGRVASHASGRPRPHAGLSPHYHHTSSTARQACEVRRLSTLGVLSSWLMLASSSSAVHSTRRSASFLPSFQPAREGTAGTRCDSWRRHRDVTLWPATPTTCKQQLTTLTLCTHLRPHPSAEFAPTPATATSWPNRPRRTRPSWCLTSPSHCHSLPSRLSFSIPSPSLRSVHPLASSSTRSFLAARPTPRWPHHRRQQSVWSALITRRIQ